MNNSMFRVNDSPFVIELLPDGDVVIWDANASEALDEWVMRGMPMEMRPPFPIVAQGMTEEEAFDWLAEEMGLERPYVPVTRIQ